MRLARGLGRWRRWLAGIATGCLLGGLAYAAMVAGADEFLAVRTKLGAADVIVVLGGDGPPRAALAAHLFRAGLAPRVLVTGDGDCRDIRALMRRAGVPAKAIGVECASANTYENATFTAPMLAAMAAHSGIVVTSWFHTRRALGCFDLASPTIRWLAAPVRRDDSLWTLLWDAEGWQIAKEYIKFVWYIWHYNVAWNPQTALPGTAKRQADDRKGEPAAASGLPLKTRAKYSEARPPVLLNQPLQGRHSL